jgi:hypothetical protein
MIFDFLLLYSITLMEYSLCRFHATVLFFSLFYISLRVSYFSSIGPVKKPDVPKGRSHRKTECLILTSFLWLTKFHTILHTASVAFQCVRYDVPGAKRIFSERSSMIRKQLWHEKLQITPQEKNLEILAKFIAMQNYSFRIFTSSEPLVGLKGRFL